MKFSELKINDKFYMGSSLYRKVGKNLYTYDSDKNALWKYWTPPHTCVKIHL